MMRIPFSRMLAHVALAASAMFGNPRGEIERRGRYESHTKKGRGRRAASSHCRNHGGSKWLHSGQRGRGY